MEKFIISIGLIIIGLCIGQILRYMVDKNSTLKFITVSKCIQIAQGIALLVLNPIISIGAFWIIKIEDIRLIIVPILGLSALILGGVLGFLAAKALNLERKQTGSLFVSASFTNLGSFGGLICYIFFGEASYAFVSMYKLFEQLYYYTIGYPIAKIYGNMNTEKHSISSFIIDPYILTSSLSILFGIILNLSIIDRPNYYSTINNILIPFSSFLLVTSVGFKMRITAIGNYIKECLAVSIIKFIIVPFTITLFAYLLNLNEISDGLLLKIILILSSMPPAFNSLIPPQIYGLDTDLANSSWLFNTAALIIVLPIIYAIQIYFL